jgi:hypothetical protein
MLSDGEHSRIQIAVQLCDYSAKRKKSLPENGWLKTLNKDRYDDSKLFPALNP